MRTGEQSAGFTSILVCVAEGTTSDPALRAACALANTFGANLELLHVMPPLIATTVGIEDAATAALTASAIAGVRTTLRAHMAHRHADIEVGGVPLAERLEVAVGMPARVVLERLRERRHDLVVVGESGKRKQLDLGGVARVLFSKADCPVWMQTAPARAVRRILVPFDMSPTSITALERAIALARKFEATITVLHAFEAPVALYGAEIGLASGPLPYNVDEVRRAEQAAFAQALEARAWHGVVHTAEFVDEHPTRAVLAAQDRHDLIVLGTHGHGALTAALLGSVARQVVRLAHTAVLTIRDPRGKFAL